MELTEEVKALLLNTAKELKGSAPHVHGADGASPIPGWEASDRTRGEVESRNHMQRNATPVKHGIVCVDGFSLRGRKRSEDHLPILLSDITAIVDGQSQADPQFRTMRLYTRLTATEVRRQLIGKFGYTDEELPTAETIATKLNMLGYYPKKVAKSQPPKNSPRRMLSSPR